ncbi:DUF6083 domain-containing protein [Streptomyces virginiae]|uniref:DUF6083 domain-containing protein n=1 Tax=Streptomyces virginiae TaxID=1961 RepID=UPI0033AC8D0A
MSTPAPWDSTSQPSQTMRLHPHTPSKALRRDSVGRCLYCYNTIWWYDRADGGRIPLLPGEFPTVRVPQSVQWSVDAGLARQGSTGDFCCIPHPVVCPGIEHDEFNDPGLADLYRQSALNMQAAVREGHFSAPLFETPEEEGAEVGPVKRPCRDIIAYHSVHLVVPTTVGELRCVALSEVTGERCSGLVLDPDAIYQGEWVEQQIPHPRGRVDEPALWEGQTMWVWSLNNVTYQDSVRWRSQRCPAHGAGSTAPDVHPRECEHFDPIGHGYCIRHVKPATAATFAPEIRQAQRTRCAEKGCLNGKTGRVPEQELVPGVGWLCWKCRPKYTKRRITHRRWQSDPEA